MVSQVAYFTGLLNIHEVRQQRGTNTVLLTCSQISDLTSLHLALSHVDRRSLVKRRQPTFYRALPGCSSQSPAPRQVQLGPDCDGICMRHSLHYDGWEGSVQLGSL
jgi:hypothetical protein